MSNQKSIPVGKPAGKDHPVYKDVGVATVTPVKKTGEQAKDSPTKETPKED